MYHREHVYRIQAFLNKRINAGLELDGRTGRNSKTADSIAKYQEMIGVYPTDGVWGPNTMEKMPLPDKKRLKDLVAEEGGFFDKFLHFFNLD
jgi:murein L,D-transpeptidase YcbB/YkuD